MLAYHNMSAKFVINNISFNLLGMLGVSGRLHTIHCVKLLCYAHFFGMEVSFSGQMLRIRMRVDTVERYCVRNIKNAF